MAVAAGGAGAHSNGARIVIDPRSPDWGNSPASSQRPSYGYTLEKAEAPIISIVTPFFDAGAIFHETAKSVFAQSLQAWEWVIVNDGSSDPGALGVLAGYRDCDPRVRVIDLPARRGPSRARNEGCHAACARFLLMLDSDDLLEPTAAEKWWWFLESYPEFGFTKGFSVGFGAMQYLAATGFHQERAFLERNHVDITALMRVDVFRAVGGFPDENTGGLEDWQLWLRCAAHGIWGGTIPEFLSWYRRRDDDALRWPNWQGDGGSATFRRDLRERFDDLYSGRKAFPAPRPRQIPEAVTTSRPAVNGLKTSGPRLLILVPWLTTGGADKFNLDLIAQLTSLDWQVSVASTRQGDTTWLPEFTALTPDVFVLPHFLRLSDYPRFLAYLIESRRIDVVLITNSELGYELLPYLREHAPGTAFVDFCHMEEEDWQEGGYPRQSLAHARELDLSVVLSEHLRRWMVERGRTPDDVVVSHHGVHVPPTSVIAAHRARYRASWQAGDLPVVTFAARAVAQKQPQLFADVVRRLVERKAKFMVVVAGDGPELPLLRTLMSVPGLADRVRLLGEVPSDVMDGVLCATDVLCLPSQWEGISLVVEEAMARGVAVVAADVGGQRELVAADCGVLIPPGEYDVLVSAYADAVHRLIADADARGAIGARARERVCQAFRVEQMGQRMDALLRATVGAPRRVQSPNAGRRPDVAGSDNAAAVTEAFQAQYVPYWQWVQSVADGQLEAPARWNTRLFRSLTVLEPAYRWGLRRGWTWLPRLRRKLRGGTREILRLDR